MRAENIVFMLVVVAATGFFAYSARRLISYLRIARADPRLGEPAARLKNVLTIAIFQRKIFRDPVAGPMHALIFWGFIVLTAGLGACGRTEVANRRGSHATAVESVTPQAPTREESAELRLAAYLRSALVTNAVNREDTVYACIPEYIAEPRLALATFRVLGSRLVRESAHVYAEVVSVAEEVADATPTVRYVTTIRTRVDTLHWTMIRDSTTHLWGICDYADEGVDFRILGTDKQTRWIPPSGSWAEVRRVARQLQSGS